MHLAYEPPDPFTPQPQHQVPPTSHTPARTLIEMHSPLPTPLIQLQPPDKLHLIECGRPICTPAVYTSSVSVGGALQVNDDVYTAGVHIGRPHSPAMLHQHSLMLHII